MSAPRWSRGFLLMRQTFSFLALLLVVFVSCKRGETPAASTADSSDAKQGAAQAGAPQAASAPGTDVGATMPEYTAAKLDGSKFDLASTRGNVVLLNVWATWCGPCRFEIPELQAIHDHYAAKGFEVVGVSVDEGTADPVRQFVQEHKMTYPVVLDPEQKLTNLLQTSVLPTTLLLDRTGRIAWKKYGAIMPNDEGLKKAIEEAL